MNPDFLKRKKDILSKQDKSSKQGYDEKIKDLCEKINQKQNYYTTSSCSGRVVVVKDISKSPGVFLFASHDLIDFENLKKELEGIKDNGIFKQEPCILHVACREFKDAEKLLKKAQLGGWKRSGIISSKDKFICELLSTEKLEFPIADKGKLLVDDDFLKVVVEKSNENLEKSWEKIGRLKSLL